MSSAVALTLTECPNCAAPLDGKYCAECGQKRGPLNPTFHDLAHDVVHEFLHLDGKIFRSFWLLLTKPGFLTLEAFRGRRASYISPIRLYLLFSVAAFGVIALMPHQPIVSERDLAEMRAEQGLSVRNRGVRVDVAGMNQEQRARLAESIGHLFPRAMFVLVPACALLVQLHARRARKNYPQHLFFALHVHAAYFAVLALTTPLEELGRPAGGVVSLLRVAFVLVYSAIAFRRVYGYSRIASIVRTVSIFTTYMTLVTIAFLVTAGVAYMGVRK